MSKDWKKIKWLYSELPDLVGRGVLTEDAAASLKLHYGEPDKSSGLKFLVGVFAVFGALLIGSGVILILAHNWDSLGREARAFVSIAPSVLGLFGLGWAMAKGGRGTALAEALCGFQTLAIGAALALVGQTYNAGGDLQSLLFVWFVLSLPLAFLFDSAVCASLCLAIFTSFACQRGAVSDWMFWSMLILAIPYPAWAFSRGFESLRTVFLGWAAAIAATISIFSIGVHGHGDSLCGVMLACAFSAMYMAGFLLDASSSLPAWRNPLKAVGATGALIMALIFSFSDSWRWSNWTDGSSLSASVVLVYLLAVAAIAPLAALCVRRDFWALPFGLVGPLVFFFLLLPYEHLRSFDPASILLNALVLAMGICCLTDGVKRDLLGKVNCGLVILAAWILCRFFSTEFGFLTRGLAFIFMGAAFLSVNLVMLRRKRAAAASSEGRA